MKKLLLNVKAAQCELQSAQNALRDAMENNPEWFLGKPVSLLDEYLDAVESSQLNGAALEVGLNGMILKVTVCER